MLYLRNIAFTKLIRADGRLREFNFRRKFIGNVAVYDIDVNDERNRRLYFSMQLANGQWTIREQEVQDWIRAEAFHFHTAIEEREK